MNLTLATIARLFDTTVEGVRTVSATRLKKALGSSAADIVDSYLEDDEKRLRLGHHSTFGRFGEVYLTERAVGVLSERIAGVQDVPLSTIETRLEQYEVDVAAAEAARMRDRTPKPPTAAELERNAEIKRMTRSVETREAAQRPDRIASAGTEKPRDPPRPLTSAQRAAAEDRATSEAFAARNRVDRM